MRSSGWRELECLGATSHRSSANGTASGNAFGVGPRRVCGNAFWLRWPTIPISKQSSSMEQSSGHTNMRPAEGGIQEQAIGRSRGGLSTKIHIAVDALGNVLRLLYSAGQVHESTKAEALIAGLPADNVIADKAFDSDRFRAHLADRGITAVIPSNASRARAIPYDCHLYKERHLVELFINKIKHFRRIATRYDKTIASYASFVAVAGFMLWMR